MIALFKENDLCTSHNLPYSQHLSLPQTIYISILSQKAFAMFLMNHEALLLAIHLDNQCGSCPILQGVKLFN